MTPQQQIRAIQANKSAQRAKDKADIESGRLTPHQVQQKNALFPPEVMRQITLLPPRRLGQNLTLAKYPQTHDNPPIDPP